eukprot:gene5940-4249_t
MEQPKGINILITGTPGTGKTSMTTLLAETLPDFIPIEVGKLVKENHWFSEYDSELDTHIIEEADEDAMLDYLEPIMVERGNHIVDYHSSELFPERWFHLVVVLKTRTETLYDRLQKRGYKEVKVSENMEAEIQCVCEMEARDSYKEEIILVRDNDTLEDMEQTVELIAEKVAEMKANRGLE